MSRYYHENSPVYIQGTDTPVNKLGLEDPELLHEIEAHLLEEAYRVFIDELQTGTVFDEPYFKSLHRRTFKTLYDWAGEYRTVNMSKAGSIFCQPAYLQAESQRIFTELAQDGYLKHGEKWSAEHMAEKLAYYACELIVLHPFYELNGRITRLFFDLIAVYNGYELIDYTEFATPSGMGGNPYIEASIDCVQFADCAKMQVIMFRGLKRPSTTTDQNID
jgi:cell filamentation protein